MMKNQINEILKNSDDKICGCMCHTKGLTVKHIRSCCKYSYQPYKNVDGSIDMEAYNKIVKEREEKK